MTISSVMVSWAVLERLAEPGRLALGSRGGRGGVSSVLGAIRGRALRPLRRAISSSSCWNALFELLDALLLEGDDVEQLPDQRRAFGLRDVGQQNPHDRIRPATSRPICPGLLRSYASTT